MSLALFLGAVLLFAALAKIGRLRELHHAYYGIAFGIAGITLDMSWLAWLGLILVWDDAVQHAVQVFRPSFLSPLHWLYGVTLWRLPIVQRLNRWLDETL